MKVLIIEDDEVIVKPLKKILENAKFEVDTAPDGKMGLYLIDLNSYDCIVLDLNLPEIDGITVAKKLRNAENTVPIIMLTARSQMYDKLEGFSVGTDDYMTKPFESKELIARIHSLIKRSSINKVEKLEMQDCNLVPESNTVTTSKGEKIELSNKETGLLEYLLRNKGKIISSEELLSHVWDSNADEFSDTIKTHIKTLRKKIDPDKKIIKTIKGKGYVIES